jgi:hypothetical protein
MTETNVSADEAPKQPGQYAQLAYAGVEVRNVAYVDQIPPFDITLTAANEYGQLAIMRLYGVEFLNEGAGLSVDDIVNERSLTLNSAICWNTQYGQSAGKSIPKRWKTPPRGHTRKFSIKNFNRNQDMVRSSKEFEANINGNADERKLVCPIR